MRWLRTFQIHVDDICGSDNIIFTAEIWKVNENEAPIITKVNDNINIIEGKYFPFLDIALFWSNHEKLKFMIYMKPNQQLKYLNKGSNHSASCFKAIATGVFGRLSKLTSECKKTMNSRLDELYPEHAKALKHAKLAPDIFPKMKEVPADLNVKEEEKKKKESRRKVSRQVYFCIGICEVWKGKNAIHKTLKMLIQKYNLKWLRQSMSYHKFSNLREILQGDLSGKLMKGVGSRDFDALPCNCSTPSKRNGICIYNSKCRHSIVVYKATCKLCDANYIGNTQTHLKQRMNLHFNDVKSLVSKGIRSDTFAKHFARHFKKGTKPTSKQIRDIMDIDVIWKGNPISCVKSFGKVNCSLCMKERLAILRASRNEDEKKKMINANSELYGACRHKPKFHRFTTYNSSADDGRTSPERVSTNIFNYSPPPSTNDRNENLNICTEISTTENSTPNDNFISLLTEVCTTMVEGN